MDFLDNATITVESGAGGDGVIRWRREKFVEMGGPAGGDGGDGGSVYIQANRNLNTLLNFKYQKNFIADAGKPGESRNKSGLKSKDLYIQVPLGTQVRTNDLLIADLIHDNQTVLIAKGGQGGRGNQHFATSTKQAPNYCEPGKPGQKFILDLELKLIANIGLIGLPNAGKSTLLSQLSAAKPKIANYPFTTLKPNLGIIKLNADQALTIADIPGLIEGASQGVGLGHDFLRHVEHCKYHFHLIDCFEAAMHEDVNILHSNYLIINEELKKYDTEKFENYKQIVLLNKIDSCEDDLMEEIRQLFDSKNIKYIEISAVTGSGIDKIKQYLQDNIDAILIKYTDENEDIIQENQEKIQDQTLLHAHEHIITKEEHEDNAVFTIQSEYLAGLIRVTLFDNYDSVNHLYRRLRHLGILQRLEKQNIKSGDTILIRDNIKVIHEMTWSEYSDYSLI